VITHQLAQAVEAAAHVGRLRRSFVGRPVRLSQSPRRPRNAATFGRGGHGAGQDMSFGRGGGGHDISLGIGDLGGGGGTGGSAHTGAGAATDGSGGGSCGCASPLPLLQPLVVPVPQATCNDSPWSVVPPGSSAVLAAPQNALTLPTAIPLVVGLEEDIFVLEVGLGVGLFARLFLDAFRARSAQEGKDYYERLHYVAGDYSGRMLRDACQHGIFENHPGRCLLRQLDALDPAAALREEPLLGEQERPFRAVFLNYLLDCLPATVVRSKGQESQVRGQQEQVRELFVRSCLAPGVYLREHTDMSLEELAEKIQAGGAEDRAELLQLFGLLTSEYAFRPADLTDSLCRFREEFARSSASDSVWHSYGAIQCLERLLSLVRQDGFILFNDYGHTDPKAGEQFEHQRISGPRGHRPGEKTVECFRQLFGKGAHEERQEPLEIARACLQAGAYDSAATAYQKALERQPLNWLLMSEIAKFLTFTLKAPESGLAMARQALALNPACSPDLWNTYGNSLFVLGRHADARLAFQRALAINPNDVRAWYNLSFVYAQEKD
jgi:tetratricopeptide (TPR) repeat protein